MRPLLPLLSLLFCLLPLAAQNQPTAEAFGLVFQTLSDDDLTAVERGLGRRTGVEIIAVKPGTPGAAAGLKPGLMLNVGSRSILTAEAAVAALQAVQGDVEVIVMTPDGEEWTPRQYTLKLGGAVGAAAQDNLPPNSQDPITAYFDLMDFLRTEAWERPVVTPADERQRVAALARQFFNEMSAPDQAQLLAVPQTWAMVQQNWKQADAAERTKQRARWREQLLLPTNLLPPPAQVETFQAAGNLVGFEYPAQWTGGYQEIEGVTFLFVAPGGAAASWQQVLDTPKSPSGALFALFDLTPEMQQLPDWVAGARFLARQLMPTAAQGFRETSVLPISDEGAVITLQGRFPGQQEEKFYWIGVTRFGSDKIFAGRLGGSVAEADAILPGFRHMLTTLQLNPPQAATGGGGVSGAWQAAWSRVDVAITKNIWAR